MRDKRSIPWILGMWLFVLLSALAACGGEKKERAVVAASRWISAYTTGEISRKSSITVEFSQEILPGVEHGAVVKDGILSISPAVKGSLRKVDEFTLRFEPEGDWESGETYRCKVNFARLFPKDEEVPEAFEFSFSIVPLDASFEEVVLRAGGDIKEVDITGRLDSSDVVADDVLEKSFSVQGVSFRRIEWEHEGKEHRFRITGIPRGETGARARLKVDLSVLGGEGSVEKVVEIPNESEFKVLSSRVDRNARRVDVVFSLPLDPDQSLEGFVRIEGAEPLRLVRQDNILSIYFPQVQAGKYTVRISKDLRSSLGSALGRVYVQEVVFQVPAPEVELLSPGGIVPGVEEAYFPFKARGLRAVDVTVVEVHPGNIVHFFHTHAGFRDKEEWWEDPLAYVGKVVACTTVRLDDDPSFDPFEWATFRLPLTRLVELTPGAVYRVAVNFRPSHFVGFTEEEVAQMDDPLMVPEYGGPTKGEYREGMPDYLEYDWRRREDPYQRAYYGRRREKSAFVFVSNIGFVALRSKEEVVAFVTDIRTGLPLQNVEVEAYDFQGEPCGTGKTDETGVVRIPCSSSPYLLVGRIGEEVGYLILRGDTALDVSAFEVDGISSSEGLKGFIYAERGVWRPGDVIPLFFILEDREKTLPDDYPVVCVFKDPEAKVRKRLVVREHEGRMYRFDLSTRPEDPTGVWSVEVEVGGRRFYKSIRVETVKPNRLRTVLTFPSQTLSLGKGVVPVSAQVSWLHGAPGKGLRLQVERILSSVTTRFEGFPNFSFDDPTVDFHAQKEAVFDGRVDAEGKASFEMGLKGDLEAPGMLRALFVSRAYEEGGDFSINTTSVRVSPYTSYVGVDVQGETENKWREYEANKEYALQVASVSEDGTPVSRDGIHVLLYRLDWQWWWERTSDERGNFLSRYHAQRIKDWKVSTGKDGRGYVKMSFPRWGRYLILAEDPVSGHRAGKIVYVWWSWGEEVPSEVGPALLFFEPEEQSYTVGEEVRFSIPSSPEAHLYVFLSSGSRVLKTMELKGSGEKTEVSFTVTKEMAPTVYIHVFLVQPYGQVSNDRPLRLYGVQYVSVVDPQTVLEPQIACDDYFLPEQDATIVISERSGKPMVYSLALVDEGLLDLTNFETPDPHSYFYGKEALLLRLWDVYGEVVASELLKRGRILRPGGGEGMEEVPKQRANRFPPVVMVEGPFFLEGGATRRHTLRMPQYVGSVRVMVVSAYEGAYGAAGKAVPVKAPLMVLSTLPRVAKMGDRFSMPLQIMVDEEAVGKVEVRVETEGTLALEGEGRKVVDATEPGEYLVSYPLRADRLGVGRVDAVVTSGRFSMRSTVEMDVVPPSPLRTVVQKALLEKGGAHSFSLERVGIPGTTSHVLELSRLPSLNLEQRVSYLIRYPYGCAEQTTSRAFAQLHLPELVDLTEERQREIQENVNGAILRLASFQTSEGGFAFWPGGDPHPWISSYVGHFLIEARRKGYHVPEEMWQDWLSYQKKAAGAWNEEGETREFIQAYRLFTLAAAGSPHTGAMNRLAQRERLSNRTAWRLAAAYATLRQMDMARSLVERASGYLDVRGRYYDWETYGTPLRDRAMALEALVLLGDGVEAFKVLEEIAKDMGTGRWLSTQTIAYSLAAIAGYVESFGASGKLSRVEVLWNGEGMDVVSEKVVASIPLQGEDGSLEVKNGEEGSLYVRVISSGYPPAEEREGFFRDLEVRASFLDTEGRPLDVGSLPQGTDVIVKVTVKNPDTSRVYRDVALTVTMPAGWELINRRLFGLPVAEGTSTGDYQDYRDDRVHTFFDLGPGAEKTFVFLANAAYEGRYFLPGVHCELMYEAEIQAETASRFVDVVKAAR
ncbi:alpha-2-macroglobulin domain protein [Spirochaeta thermophila DSM 6578]|uniref:Alpha-2-macroglobulin domain protein n=1 Tax=Winmispira thermophila (strain ATCC 700085 / DSM 6578 / Z-1203) TaxID=869211 RepID=G0GBK0_WINT7|nr:MG2 domain-containing protein [Spirochaeta thermophila]AEJ60359.1 alpha-2-macroglobulin domain protein [Spirochaeta thermophila DSM 6578]